MKRIKKIINQSISFKQVLLSGGTTFVYRIAGLLLNFFITFFITKNFGPSIFGNFSLVLTILQATTMIFALGLPNALINYLGVNKIDDHFSQFLLKKGLKIVLISALIPSSIYFVLKNTIATTVFHNQNLVDYILIVAIILPFSIAHEFFLNFFVATKNFLKFNVFMFVLPNIFFLLLLFLFTISKENQYFTFIFYAISILITVLIELFFVFKKHTKATIEKISSYQILQFSSPMMLSSLMLFLLNWNSVFMLGAMVSEQEVGIYNLAYKLASLAMLVIISMNIVLAPKIAELYKTNNLKELHSVIIKATRLVIILTAPIVLFLLFFSNFVLGVFGVNFVQGRTALIIISIGVMLNVLTGNVDQILNMTNHQKTLKNITVFGFILNVLLNLALIPIYGINGAATASLITNLAFNFICLFYIKKKLGFYTLF
jgi:O-antigen/teichoic acid export membrane protein